MEITGLDRMVIMVRDMDKALEFFSGKLGMKFKELDKDVQMRAGNRGCVCHETHIHLVQPFDPMPASAPPPLQKASEMLKDKEAVVTVLLFKCKDARKGSEELKGKGINVIRSWEDNDEYISVGMDNLYEYLFDPKGTLGLPVCISTWDSV